MFRSRNSALLVVWAACGGPQTPAGPPPCPEGGGVTVASQDEVDALASCTSLNRLTIRTGAPLDLAPLARLERVREHLVIGPTLAIDHLSFPALRDVGGDLTIHSNASMRGIFLPQLATVEDLTIAGNAQLTTISLPRLTKATFTVQIEDNGSLEIIDLLRLQEVGDSLRITRNPVLTTLELLATVVTQHRLVQTDSDTGPEATRAIRELQPSVPGSGGGDHE